MNAAFNESYTYDNLNRLATFTRGTHTQNFTADAQGNFSTVTTDGTGVSRTNNAQNETTVIGAASLTYDNNGNETTDETGKTYVYDAWNRLIKVKSGATTLETYSYDALGRRVTENAGTLRDEYFDASWQVVEERQGSNVRSQYAWSPAGGDLLISANVDANNDGINDTLVWMQQDALGSVTSLANSSGTVVERYAYDPYGKATIYDASWNVRATSSYAWVYLWQTGRYDTATGLYNFRNRDEDPATMRWLQEDPAQSGPNLYEAMGDGPVDQIDPSGNVVLVAAAAAGLGFLVLGGAAIYVGTRPQVQEKAKQLVGAIREGTSKAMELQTAVVVIAASEVYNRLHPKEQRDAAKDLVTSSTAAGAVAAAPEAVNKFVGGVTDAEKALIGAVVPTPSDAGKLQCPTRFTSPITIPEVLLGLAIANMTKHTADQAAVVALAKEAKNRGGISEAEAKALIALAGQVGLSSRGPEAHPNRPYGQKKHIHIGPVDHIPVN